MKRYALVGTGGRAGLYIEAISGKWKENSQLVAFCDTNQTRMNYANKLLSNQVQHRYQPGKRRILKP